MKSFVTSGLRSFAFSQKYIWKQTFEVEQEFLIFLNELNITATIRSLGK